MREEQQVSIASQAGGTKYVFAGSSERERDVGVKVCPRCGQILFEDMDVCFDCLYSFKKDAFRFQNLPEPTKQGVANTPSNLSDEWHTTAPDHANELLDDMELDEIDEVDERMPDTTNDEPVPNARHRKPEPASQDDTIDFAQLQLTESAPPQIRQFCVVVRTKDMRVRVPVPTPGLTVGRGEDNGIVLRSRLVSRQHLVLLPQEDGVSVQDCGATNPTLVQGQPLEGSVLAGAGDLIDICGITLEVEEGPAESAA